MSGRNEALAYVGIGSNLDDPVSQVDQAIERIQQSEHCTVVARSSLYVTEPVGYDDQPNFINAVCQIATSLTPLSLLNYLLQTEQKQGRVRTELQFGPRRIDLDLLLFAQESIEAQDLIVPHPRMHERRFVLEPLVEIDPLVEIPGKGRAIDFLEYCSDQNVNKI